MDRKATIEARFKEGVFRATFDGNEWLSEDPDMQEICRFTASSRLPQRDYADPVEGPARAVAEAIGGEVIDL